MSLADATDEIMFGYFTDGRRNAVQMQYRRAGLATQKIPNLAAAIDLHVLGVGEIMHGSSVGGSDMAAVGENNAGEVVVKGMTH